jgi:hypothetical protein
MTKYVFHPKTVFGAIAEMVCSDAATKITFTCNTTNAWYVPNIAVKIEALQRPCGAILALPFPNLSPTIKIPLPNLVKSLGSSVAPMIIDFVFTAGTEYLATWAIQGETVHAGIIHDYALKALYYDLLAIVPEIRDYAIYPFSEPAMVALERKALEGS